jgi:chemotaxis protein methyltransferase CheR
MNVMTTAPLCELPDADFKLLLDVIYHEYRYDFRQYAEASLRRRVSYGLRRLRLRNIGELLTWLRGGGDRFTALLQYLTVPVSEMFRDPDYYSAVREAVIPYLQQRDAPKIWIAGCSTGEEAWSMAILLREAGLLERSLIYATDINPVSLVQAERGIFSTERIRHYTENYQRANGATAFSNYYHVAYGNAVFDRALRRHICFAEHNLATDSVFSEVDFISCRNVLIYFNRDLQSRAMFIFADALTSRGLLGLGARERLSCSPLEPTFNDFVRSVRLYQKKTEFSKFGTVNNFRCDRAAIL